MIFEWKLNDFWIQPPQFKLSWCGIQSWKMIGARLRIDPVNEVCQSIRSNAGDSFSIVAFDTQFMPLLSRLRCRHQWSSGRDRDHRARNRSVEDALRRNPQSPVSNWVCYRNVWRAFATGGSNQYFGRLPPRGIHISAFAISVCQIIFIRSKTHLMTAKCLPIRISRRDKRFNRSALRL